MSEKILCAAIRKDGVVFTGKRHSDVIRNHVFLGKIFVKDCEHGFMTNKGRFVDRYEGWEIASFSKQTESKRAPLFSEDIY